MVVKEDIQNHINRNTYFSSTIYNFIDNRMIHILSTNYDWFDYAAINILLFMIYQRNKYIFMLKINVYLLRTV